MSVQKLWKEEKDIDLITERDFTKSEMKKIMSREKYFQSQCSTLPGPKKGLNCVKTRNHDKSKNYILDQAFKKKGYTHD